MRVSQLNSLSSIDDWNVREHYIEELCEEVGIDHYYALPEEVKDEFREIFNEHAFCKPDYQHFLDQEVCVDIFIDSGDYNLDLGCNQIYPHYNGVRGDPVQDECSLLWLAKTQGYSKEDFEKSINLINEDLSKSRFLESVYDELENCTSHMNALVFLKKMTLKEYLETLDNPHKPIHITKDIRCGLFDKWMGAGGLLDIRLEKDIDIDPSNIHEVVVDELFKYNIHDVYGVTDSFWKGDQLCLFLKNF